MLIEPKIIEIAGEKGSKTFVISKLPYATAGREILVQYTPTGAPFVGNYEANHALYVKMMGYVAVIVGDNVQINLSTPQLIDNHIGGDFSMGIKLETEMLEYNLGFFVQGSLSPFFSRLEAMLPQKITQIWTVLQGLLSEAEKQHSTNSGQSIQ